MRIDRGKSRANDKVKNGGRFLTAANARGLFRDRNRLTGGPDMLTDTGQDTHQFGDRRQQYG
jgi:hypothetical protein